MDPTAKNSTTEGVVDFDDEPEEIVRIEACAPAGTVRLREKSLGSGELPGRPVPAMPMPEGSNGHSPQARPRRNSAARCPVLGLRLREVPSLDPREH